MASEAQPITLERFYDSFYEDLNAEILEVAAEAERTVVVLDCDDWRDPVEGEGRRRFRFTCHEVLNPIHPMPHGWVVEVFPTTGRLIEQHYGSDWLDVYWKSSIGNPHEVLGRLYTNHERLADRQCDLRDYLVATEQTLGGDSGMMLSGPAEYARSQMEAIEDLASVYSCRSQRPSRAVTGIGFDDSILICDRIDIEEVEVD